MVDGAVRVSPLGRERFPSLCNFGCRPRGAIIRLCESSDWDIAFAAIAASRARLTSVETRICGRRDLFFDIAESPSMMRDKLALGFNIRATPCWQHDSLSAKRISTRWARAEENHLEVGLTDSSRDAFIAAGPCVTQPDSNPTSTLVTEYEGTTR